MSNVTVQSLRTFVNERLTAAAEEILGVFVKTIVVYEEEICRQRRLLDVVFKPDVKLHRTDPPQPPVLKTELLLEQQHCHQQTTFSLDQEEPEPPQVKEEQEELCTSQAGEQPLLWDIFKLAPAYDGSDHSEHLSLHSGPYQTQSVDEKEALANISSGSAVSEPDSDHQLLSDNYHVAESGGYQASSCGNAGPTSRTEPDPNKKTYKCNSCGKELPTLEKLRIHARTHTGDRPFKCDICGKGFSQTFILNTHMRSHTGERPFSCGICGKSFSSRWNLKAHGKIHTGEKPHACITCGKRFCRVDDLKLHMRGHTGEKPYSCVYCGKNFIQSSSLRKHHRVHTGEKPYSCVHCGKNFSQSSSLRKHLRVHTGEKPYSCVHCGMNFSQSSTLSKHLQTCQLAQIFHSRHAF